MKTSFTFFRVTLPPTAAAKLMVVAGALVVPGKILAQITVQQISVQHGLAMSNSTTRSIVVKPVSPITQFREWLAMTPAQRTRALMDRSPAQRENILAKIREYEAMPPEERELRLKMTEVRWYLVPLMKLAPIERTQSLGALPMEDRELIERRLRTWDAVPLDLQKLFLKNENVIGYLLRYESMTPDQRNSLLQQFSPEQRQRWVQQLAEWQSLPKDQRHQMCENFNQFFELDDKEREKTLGTLSDTERQQMEKTLEKFNDLPAIIRRRCIDSFRTFANMSQEQRDQFLQNAARWDTMSPSERQAWREIVQKSPQIPPIPPMMPPSPMSFRLIATTNFNK